MQATPPTSTQSFWKVFAALGLLIILCCLGIVCYSAGLFFVVDRDISLISTPTLNLACTDTTCLNVCIRQLPEFEIAPLGNNRAELAKRVGGIELARYKLNEETDQLTNVVRPTVVEYLEPYQADTNLHYRIWDYYTKIFPNVPELHLSYMTVYVDASESNHAARIGDLGGQWRLYVNLLAFVSPEATLEILTHEYGHMLTLNRTQLQNTKNEYRWDRKQEEFDKMQAICGSRFFTGHDCTTEKSYLNAFGNRFWTSEVYNDWVKIFLETDHDAEAYNTEQDKFYAKYSNQFIRTYAAASPREDIAESWTRFVLSPKPIGTSIADQKILFFYEYPELVQMRTNIIRNICQLAVDQK